MLDVNVIACLVLAEGFMWYYHTSPCHYETDSIYIVNLGGL